MNNQESRQLITDEQLIEEFQKTGQSRPFTILVERHKDSLMNYIYRFTGDMDVSKDILQETFIRVYKNKDAYKGIARFSTWLYTIAGNLAKSELARQKRQGGVSFNAVDDDGNSFELPSGLHAPDNILDSKIKDEFIQEALLKLPDSFREAVVLRDIQEFSYEEIAEMLQITVGTVKSRINRGRSILQKLLKDIYHE